MTHNTESPLSQKLTDVPPPPLSRTERFLCLIGNFMDRTSDSVIVEMLLDVTKIVLTPIIFIFRCMSFGVGFFLLSSFVFTPLVAPVVGPYLFDNPDFDVPLVTMSIFLVTYFSYLAYKISHGNDAQWHRLTRDLSKARHSVQPYRSNFQSNPFGLIEQARRRNNAITNHRISQQTSVGTDEQFRNTFNRRES